MLGTLTTGTQNWQGQSSLMPLRTGDRREGSRRYLGGGLMPDEQEEPQAARRLLLPWGIPTDSEFRSTNVIFWGRRRKGKTLSMVHCSHMLLPTMHKFGWKVQSNIPIEFADISHPLLGPHLNEDIDRAYRSQLVIDELTELMPSTRAMSGISLETLSLMIQIRKLQAEMLTTTQFPTDIQGKMLRQLDLYVLCDAHIPPDARWNPESARKAFVNLWVFDLWGQFSGGFQVAKYFPPPLFLAIKRIQLVNLYLSWNAYNTLGKVVSAFAKGYAKERYIQRGWNMSRLARLEEEAELRSMTEEERESLAVAEREFDQMTEARFVEAAELPRPVVPQVTLSAKPLSLEAWLRDKAVAGRFSVNVGTLTQVRQWVPQAKMVDLLHILEDAGFAIDTQGRYKYAQKRG